MTMQVFAHGVFVVAGTPNATVYRGNEGIRHGRHYATKRQDANEQLGQGIEPEGLGQLGQGIEPEGLEYLGQGIEPKGSGTKKPARAKTASARSGSSSRTTRSASASRASSNGAKRSTTTGARRSTTTRSNARRATPATASSNGSGGVADTVKHVATKAAGPAVAVGAAAAGIAGGIVLKSRMRRKTTVLGVTLPRAIGKGLPDLDAKSIAKSVGHASKQFAKTTKNVSKDLERAGRLGRAHRQDPRLIHEDGSHPARSRTTTAVKRSNGVVTRAKDAGDTVASIAQRATGPRSRRGPRRPASPEACSSDRA